MPRFIQLTWEDCNYLLNLINDIDADTVYTARQRTYTVPKLARIAADSRSARLDYRDITYLLELLEDDDLPQYEQQRCMTQSTLEEIQALRQAHRTEWESRQNERHLRRLKRQGKDSVDELTEHFEHTAAGSN